jgi:hypothetical protein
MYNESRLKFSFVCLREQYQTHDLCLPQWYKHHQNSEVTFRLYL